jgi:hypothetical protein
MTTAPHHAVTSLGGVLSSVQVPLNLAGLHAYSAPTTGAAVQTLADRYRMTKKVGDGTFGEVSLAIKMDTGDVVAIKKQVPFSSFIFLNECE